MKPIKVIIAGGGTGGHIFPAVAIANALKKCNAATDILFVGAEGKMEMEKVPKEGYKIIGLPIAGMNRSNPLKNISLPIKMLQSFVKAKQIIESFKPDIAIGVGGYASFPILYMAQRAGVATLLQEQNGFAGKSNKILGKRANTICVAYDGMEKFFPAAKIVLTGNPVRTIISKNTCLRSEAIDFFNLDHNKKTILITGGSLGAKAINDTIIAQINKLLSTGVQIIWQTGKPAYNAAMEIANGNTETVKVFDFIQRMDMAYAVADVVISRSGALSIAEQCLAAKPVIYVPYPHAAEDHQTANAMALVKKNAAILVRDVDAKTQLVDKTIELLQNETMQDLFTGALKQAGIADADERIVNEIYKIVNTKA
jgi:UDP-N-acetylglucosamine--N-acetylmuramyl-(pentapeptide) pyrophosphoryl-undecaprenol N-acetylglucosamine transferase